MTITYRKATKKDSSQIGAVLQSCYNIKSLDEGKDVFNSEHEKHYHYIVACEGEMIIGIVTWVMHGLAKHGLFELDRIAVIPEARGKGAAVQLFKELEKDVKNSYEKKGAKPRKLYILTHEDNKRAQSFYKKMGTLHETTLKSHYYDGKDEFVFSKFYD